MATIGYARVSSREQNTAAQKHSIENKYNIERWFNDDAVSGAVKAMSRPGFKALFDYARDGDVVVVAAIDRLGRNTVDVLETVESLRDKGVTIISEREGFDLSTPMGKAMLTMLAAVGELERSNSKARQMAGLERAKAKGKVLGRPATIDYDQVRAWRRANSASIKETSQHFGISPASVKRACQPA